MAGGLDAPVPKIGALSVLGEGVLYPSVWGRLFFGYLYEPGRNDLDKNASII